jgi:hypothetical protein
VVMRRTTVAKELNLYLPGLRISRKQCNMGVIGMSHRDTCSLHLMKQILK